MKKCTGGLGLGLTLCAVTAHAADGPTYRPRIGEDIVVTAQRGVPLSLLTQPLLDTPQGIDAIPSDTIELQGLNDLRDVLRDDPAVSNHADEDSAQGTNVQIRGFSARNDLYVDGQLDIGRYYRDPFWLQEVDVLTGPSSVLFGRGSTGGAVNQVSRKPVMQPLAAGTLALGTEGLRRLTTDFDLPLGGSSAFRLEAMGHEDGIAERDLVGTRRLGVAPSLSFGIGRPTTLTLSALHQSQWDMPDYGVPWIDLAGRTQSHPADVPFRNFYGFSNDFSNVTADIVTATLRHEGATGIVLRDQFRYGDYWQRYQATEPSVTALVAPGTDFSDIDVTRTLRGGSSRQSIVENQIDLTARFTTFGLEHTLVAGGALGWQTSDAVVLSYSGVPTTNLADPAPYQPFIGASKVKSDTLFSADTESGSLSDTIALGQAWQVSGSARIDRFAAVYKTLVPSYSTLKHIDVLPSFRAALVYKPARNASLYVMWGNSFDPSAENLSLSASTADLAPERTHTLEAGGKWNPNGGLLLSAALFRTVQDNMREADPADPSYDILAGNARARGFTVSAQGRISRRWLVQGGYTFLDTKIIASPDGDLGQSLQNAPRNSVRLFTAYDVTDRLQLGGGVQYSSSRVPASVIDGNGQWQSVPGYVLGSVTVRYAMTRRLALQANIDNIANARFFDGLDDNHVNPGAGRAVRFSLVFNE